ncbi:hypothetical protein F2Q69_00033674 [Brassica cretica]|uniref:Uncharacterized protein n=1 Tax=Brassica cretica TaxID=69181 RepID=A0A8S9SKU9_BRACR|nr:hypothetical protein F2Q69_00033674 [Brassica cretica]
MNEETCFRNLVSFRYHVFEIFETNAMGLGQDLGLLSVLSIGSGLVLSFDARSVRVGRRCEIVFSQNVRYTFVKGSLKLEMPPPFSVVIQESEKGSWHVPITCKDGEESLRNWICVTRQS